jgi:hypothetical protein
VCVDAVPAREQLRHAQSPVNGTRVLSRDKERADEGAASRRDGTRGAHGRWRRSPRCSSLDAAGADGVRNVGLRNDADQPSLLFYE